MNLTVKIWSVDYKGEYIGYAICPDSYTKEVLIEELCLIMQVEPRELISVREPMGGVSVHHYSFNPVFVRECFTDTELGQDHALVLTL